MKTTFLLLLLCLLSSLCNASAADDAARLSLGEVTRAVLAQNPAIKASFGKWNAAKARVPQAAAWDDPRITAESRVQRFVDIAPNAFTDQMVSIEQMIPISGKNRARARIAVAEAVAAYEDVRRQELDSIAAARSAFFRLANAYAQLEVNRKNIESLKQIADISRTKYETGTESAADVLVAETEATSLVEAQRDLERQLSEQESRLNQLMNRDAFAPVGEPTVTSFESPEMSAVDLRRLMLAQRPEIKIAEAKVQAQQSKLQLAQRAWIPDPALGLKAQRYNEASQAVSELDLGVSFTVPWVNFRKYGAEAREAAEETGAARQGLEREQKEALRLLRDQLEKIETFHHHVELFRDKLVPQAQQAFEANRLSYESGKTSFLDWITAQRNFRDLEAKAREHFAEYQIALAELEAITGGEIYPSPAARHTHEGKSP